MIGQIIGAGVGAAANIFGGVMAGRKMSQVKDNIKEQMAKNQAWYEQRYNEDATQRADAQRILTMTEESIKNRNRQAAAAAAVMGGTEESVAASKAANAQAMSDAAAQIAVAGDKRKDAIEAQYQQREAALQSQLNDMRVQQAQNIQNAAAGVADAAGKIGGMF
jgi:hypothetical protein